MTPDQSDAPGHSLIDRIASALQPRIRRLINVAIEPSSSATADRPTGMPTGYPHFDTTLGIPVWWNGAAWVNASGAAV